MTECLIVYKTCGVLEVRFGVGLVECSRLSYFKLVCFNLNLCLEFWGNIISCNQSKPLSLLPLILTFSITVRNCVQKYVKT